MYMLGVTLILSNLHTHIHIGYTNNYVCVSIMEGSLHYEKKSFLCQSEHFVVYKHFLCEVVDIKFEYELIPHPYKLHQCKETLKL